MDVKDENYRNYSPVHYAARDGLTDIMDLLIKAGADVEARTSYGQTPAQFAAANYHPQILKLLQVAGAAFNAKSNSEWTLAHFAARDGNRECLEVLVEGGADLTAKNEDGKTPAHLAVQRGHKQILEYLVQHGVKLDFDGLISAAVENEMWDEAITLMTEHNAPFEKTDFEKILKAVFTLELTVKREKIIDFLQELGRDGFSILTNESKVLVAIDHRLSNRVGIRFVLE